MACKRVMLLHGLRRTVGAPKLARTACTALALTCSSSSRPSQRSFQPAFHLTPRLTLTTRTTHSYAVHPTECNSTGVLLSRVAGPTTPALFEGSLGEFWQGLIVSTYADNTALVSAHEPPDAHALQPTKKETGDEACLRWSFSEMNAHVHLLARGMRSLGIAPGERVAVLAMNSSSMAALQLATALVGAPLVTLNPSYAPRELARALKHVGAKALFIVPSLRTTDYTQHLKAILPSLSQQAPDQGGAEIQDEALPLLRNIVLIDNMTGRPNGWESESTLAQAGVSFAQARSKLNGWAWDYREVLEMGREGEVEMGVVQAHDVVNLQLTSGTTGASKAVALSSHNLTNNARSIGTTLNLKPDDLLANVPPLFHCFGLTLGNLAAWSRGAGVLYCAEGFNAVRTLRSASRENVSALNGVPAHFVALLEALRQLKAVQESGDWKSVEKFGVREGEKWEFERLRTGLMSGSTIPIELMHACIRELGAEELTVVYGMTECSPVISGVDTTAPLDRRCETVGRTYPHAHAKIVAPDDEMGEPLPVGAVGELVAGGYLVMNGYYNDPEKTAEVVSQDADGLRWMRTGDLASIDAEGYLTIRGRVKDVIIRAGENLFPPVIENCIDELPGVATSAVVSVPDERFGETVSVFIVRSGSSQHAQLTPARVRAHVKEHLSGQSAPDWVWFCGDEDVPDALPATASGKVQKVILRTWAKELADKGVGRAASVNAAK